MYVGSEVGDWPAADSTYLPVARSDCARASIEKGDLGGRIGGHSWKKREMNLVAHCALLLFTSPLYSPPRTETVAEFGQCELSSARALVWHTVYDSYLRFVGAGCADCVGICDSASTQELPFSTVSTRRGSKIQRRWGRGERLSHEMPLWKRFSTPSVRAS